MLLISTDKVAHDKWRCIIQLASEPASQEEGGGRGYPMKVTAELGLGSNRMSSKRPDAAKPELLFMHE